MTSTSPFSLLTYLLLRLHFGCYFHHMSPGLSRATILRIVQLRSINIISTSPLLAS